MKKKHVEKKSIMTICTYCAWKGMVILNKWDKHRCDMCGRVGVVYVTKPCNLQ